MARVGLSKAFIDVLAPEILAATAVELQRGLFGFNVQALAGQYGNRSVHRFYRLDTFQTKPRYRDWSISSYGPQYDAFRAAFIAPGYTRNPAGAVAEPRGARPGFTANGFGFNLAGVTGQTCHRLLNQSISLDPAHHQHPWI